MHVVHPRVQQQHSGVDCGIFAIAYATEFVFNQYTGNELIGLNIFCFKTNTCIQHTKHDKVGLERKLTSLFCSSPVTCICIYTQQKMLIKFNMYKRLFHHTLLHYKNKLTIYVMMSKMVTNAIR